MVAKIGGQRGKVLAAIEAKNQKLRQQYEIKLTREVFNKFDDDNNHSISKCEFENAMYQDKFQNDVFQNNDGPVVVHG